MSGPHSPDAPDPNRPIDGDLSHFGHPMYAPNAEKSEPFHGLDYPSDPIIDTPVLTDLGLTPLPSREQRPTIYLQPIPRAKSEKKYSDRKHPDRPSHIPQDYYDKFIAPPSVKSSDTVWPKIELDYDTPKLPNPNVVSMPHGPLAFDMLAFGGLRRRIFERRYLRRPAEKLEEAEQEQNFYRSLANTAFMKAGIKLKDYPDEAEPVTVYDPENAVVTDHNGNLTLKSKGAHQRRQSRRILGHPGWIRNGRKIHGKTGRITRHLNGLGFSNRQVKGTADFLGEAYENSLQSEDARKGIEARKKKHLNRFTQGVEDRLPPIEKAKKYHKMRAKVLIKWLDAGKIDEDKYKEKLGEEQHVLDQKIATIEIPHNRPKSKHQRKQEKHANKYARRIIKKTETGFRARGRKNDITKWHRRVENAPERAQKRLEKLDKKVANQIKRRKFYKRAAKKTGSGVVSALKSPATLARKIKNSTPSATPPTTP